MSRMDQYIGLSKEAFKFLEPMDCVGHYEINGAWNQISLSVYFDEKFGFIYKEVVQAEPWSSGPMYFTRLAQIDNRTGEFVQFCGEWKTEEIEQCQ